MTPAGVVAYPFVRIDWLLLPLVGVLLTVGFFTLVSATDSPALPDRQFTYLLAGGLVMVVCACVPWVWWRRAAAPLYIGTLLLLLAVPLVGVEVNNSRRWLAVGSLSLQPSELAKVTVPLMVAWFYCLTQHRHFWQHPVAFALLALPAALVFAQPDLGTAVMVATGGLMVIFLAGLSWWVIGSGAILGAMAAPVIWTEVLKDYQRARILSVLDPSKDPLGAGYHTIQSSIAVGSGGLNGKGWGQGTQSQLGFLPEQHTDFIFAVFAEEWGFVGCMALLGLVVVAAMRMMTVAARAQCEVAALLVGALAMSFLLQAFINLGMVSGVLPVVGLPLPLVSYGGTSLLTYMVSFGIIMAVVRHRGRENQPWVD